MTVDRFNLHEALVTLSALLRKYDWFVTMTRESVPGTEGQLIVHTDCIPTARLYLPPEWEGYPVVPRYHSPVEMHAP